jgi:membrane protein DedA with SNARE-associated domain
MLIPVPSQIGYPVLAALVFGGSAGLPIPGETALITAAGLAAGGTLSLPLVIAITVVAAVVGDTLGYLVGRRGGRRVLLRDGFGAVHRRHAVERADRFFARNGTATVFFGRWVPGVRIVAAVMAGTTRMPWRRFVVANAAGAACWATTVALLAHALGPGGAAALAAAGLALGGVTFAVSWWRMRRRTATLTAGCSAPSPSARA